ncbi:MAG: polysaccharide biosynthesis/export family protein [Thermodesulfobacteriota bacterium]
MKKILFIAIYIFFFPSFPLAGEIEKSSAAVRQDYQIGQGDVLFISVWKDEALTKQCIVLPDGKIYFPLVGELIAAGKTVAELQQEIKERVKKYVPDPILHLEVQQVNSLAIYLIGRVNRPGRYDLRGNTDVLQALAMAGGLNPFAEEDEIKIFRKIDGKINVLQFDYSDVAEGRSLIQNIMLQRDDIIIVP